MFRIFPRTVTVIFLFGVFCICLGLALRTSAHQAQPPAYPFQVYRR